MAHSYRVHAHAAPVAYAMVSASPMPEPAPVLQGMMQGQPEGAMGQASDVKDDLFAGTEEFAKNASDVTEINMDPESLGMVGGQHANRAHSMVLNVVRTYSYDKPGMYDMAAVDKYRAKLNTGDWHCSVHTRDIKHGSSSDICNKRRTDGMRETAIITAEPRELTFIHTIRKESGDGGSSQILGPMSLNLGPMIAMTDAPELAALNAQLARLNGAQVRLDGIDLDPERMAELQARMAEAQARVAERMKEFDSPEFKERMQRMQEDVQRNMERFNSPEFKEKFDKLQKDLEKNKDLYKQKLEEQKDKEKTQPE